jgi:hypothetical protein
VIVAWRLLSGSASEKGKEAAVTRGLVEQAFDLGVPPHFVAFVWRYLRVHPFFSLSDRRVHRRGLELVTRYSSRDLH